MLYASVLKCPDISHLLLQFHLVSWVSSGENQVLFSFWIRSIQNFYIGIPLSPVSGLPKAKVFNRSQSFEKLQTLQFQVLGIAILPDTLHLPCSLPSSLTRVDIKQGKILSTKAELLQLNRTQFPSLGIFEIFVSKKVGNQKS